MIQVLAGIGAGTTAVLIALVAWLAYRLVAAMREVVNAADLLDGQRKLVAEYKHKFDAEFVAHGVTTERLRTEANLRAVAEAQRNEAQVRCRAYLARSLEGATKDDINAVLVDLFASPLSIVPQPKAGRADAPGPDRLVDPFADV